MKLIIDIPQGMIDAFSHEEQWTAVICRDMNTVLQKGTPYEERPKGKWINDGHHIRCNRCNEYICNTDSEGNEIPDNFCPNCGSRLFKD